MTFIAEDGSGLSNANSLVTLEFADDYFSTRNIAEWQGDDHAKQGWLIQATDYVETRYAGDFLYDKLTTTQALSFPWKEKPTMPENLKKAVCEYALRAMKGPLMPDPATGTDGKEIEETSKVVGPITTIIKYAISSSNSQAFPSYPGADKLLTGLLKPKILRVIRH